MTDPKPAKKAAAPPAPPAPADGGLFDAIRDIITEQCATPEVQNMVFRPLLRWFLWNMLPYVALFIGVNFFTTVGAMALVAMVQNKKIR